MPRGAGAPGRTSPRRRGILGTRYIFCDGPGLPNRLICPNIVFILSLEINSYNLPWKLLFRDRALKIVTERPPAVRHIKQKDIVVAFFFNLLIPGIVKSREVDLNVQILMIICCLLSCGVLLYQLILCELIQEDFE